ncbi:MAG: efflux RND transporter periplasmic adaptor subunit [Lewinellaceae bacterium]|nr:efflux RND transporter periplasmic adaptor subunit [Saprospiraceae bacterium]MCB9337878.1 efflux RND transporter periplasmic adaptor subunit [Lewinellaceae bacterium]
MNKGCIITLAAVIGILSVALGIYFYQQSKKDPVVYETEKPVITDVVKKTVATGAIKPRLEVQIKPQVSGVVDEIFVEAGQMVKKGNQIARIKLVPSQVNINNAQSSVELARIRFDEAKRELARQQDVFGKKLDVEAARVRFENAKQEDERNKKLFQDGVVSEQQYQQIKRDLDLAKAEFENTKIVSTNSLKQFEAEVNVRKEELSAAIDNLQLLREGATKNSKQVANIVVSTVDGMVLDVPVEEGTSVIERNNFNEGTSIAVVADMTSLIFEGKVDESDVGKLKEGMPLELTIGAIENKKFGATLEYIAPKGELEEGTVKFEVRAAIQPTTDVFLRAGYSASGDIILDKKEKVVTIKERDVLFEKDTTYVEVKTGEQEFQKKQVQLGLSDGIQIEVVSGLDTTSQVKVQKKL